MLGPFKANSPLHVDADTELTISIALQGFKAIAWESVQVLKVSGGVENLKTLPCLPVESLKLRDKRAVGESCSPLVTEAQDHALRVAFLDDLRQA